MKICKLASSLIVGAALSAAAFAQQAPAPSAAPSRQSSAAPSTKSGFSIGLSYDYFSFQQDYVGFKTVQAFWGPNDVFTDPGKITWKRDGGTVSIGGGKWALDGTYLQGSKRLDLPNRIGTTTFIDTVKLEDDIYDLRLRYNFTRSFYLAAGYYRQDTEQKYSFLLGTTSTPVAALSGEYSNEYVTLGLGLAQTIDMSSGWFWSFKEEATLLGGRSKGQKGIASATAAGPGQNQGTVQGESNSLFGGRVSLSSRLSWVVNDTVTLALEGGGEFRTFFDADSTSYNATESLGWFGRAAIRFSF